MNDQNEELQQEVRDMRKFLYGDPADGGKKSVSYGMLKLSDAVFGDRDNPGNPGLVSDVNELKRFRWYLLGAVATGPIVIQVIFHFWK